MTAKEEILNSATYVRVNSPYEIPIQMQLHIWCIAYEKQTCAEFYF